MIVEAGLGDCHNDEIKATKQLLYSYMSYSMCPSAQRFTRVSEDQ
jgi:hypothetical protein